MERFHSSISHQTPTSFSDDTLTPFIDLGMGKWTDEQLASYFDVETILDIGSGFEGFARRITGVYTDYGAEAPRIINLNPQFSDWWRDRDNRIRSKRLDIEDGIRERMEFYGEDADSYFASRIALAGMAQHLPFRDGSIDKAVSTWGFPRCIFDCDAPLNQLGPGFTEITRVLSDDGEALLAPVGRRDQYTIDKILASDQFEDIEVNYKPATKSGNVMIIKKK